MVQVTGFTTERPKVPAIRVTARDMVTGKSKTTTVYSTTPEAVIDAIEKAATKEPRRSKAGAA